MPNTVCNLDRCLGGGGLLKYCVILYIKLTLRDDALTFFPVLMTNNFTFQASNEYILYQLALRLILDCDQQGIPT